MVAGGSNVLGVGLNVNHAALPEELSDRATSLRLASGRPHSRLEILVEFLEQFEGLIDRFQAGGPEVVVADWTRRSSFASGRRVTIADGLRTVDGTTLGLNSYGALRVAIHPGRVEELYSGEVRMWE